MENATGSNLFANDGSFMDKFRQLEQEEQGKVSAEKPKSSAPVIVSSKPALVISKRPLELKTSNDRISNSPSSGKLAFSLKQKAKMVVAPVKLVADEEEEEGNVQTAYPDERLKRQKIEQLDGPKQLSDYGDVANILAVHPPRDPAVRKVADRLATLVAKNGRQHEHITRQRNPGDTPFKFLFDSSCPAYKYYEYRLLEEEKALVQMKETQAARTANAAATATASSSRASNGSRRSPARHQSNYKTPASALYDTNEDGRSGIASTGGAVGSGTDPIAMMEYYMKRAEREERSRQPRQSKDEMPPPASLQASTKRGHHMGDYIPQEELEKFMETCNDVAAQKSSREAVEKSKIQADNVGHKLLSRMGWREGEGLGSSKSGRADPVMAGSVKQDHLGVGAARPGEVTAEDDIYEQYKKRMMLGYKHRPNPLNNPRKAYY